MKAFQLIPGVQSYDWGKHGSDKDCLVANYAEATPELGFQREDQKPYAELWMGTHPTLPSRVKANESEQLLSQLLRDCPLFMSEMAGDATRFSTEGVIPFLFKVLSIGKALSIQAHPDKKLAQRLHAENPSMYKDDNHKPEMVIALRDFEGFCGFRLMSEIFQFVQTVPELREVMQVDDALCEQLKRAVADQEREEREWQAFQRRDDKDDEVFYCNTCVRDVLKLAFGKLMHAKPDVYEPAVEKLAKRYEDARASQTALEVSDEIAELVVRLNGQFPRDIGVMCTFFLNLVRLAPGEAMFLGANEPHAYLSGQALECMAASDNVVRAGLTPKARDVDVLVDMLTYRSARANKQLLRPSHWEGDLYECGSDEERITPSRLYKPPIKEFAVVVSTMEGDLKRSHQRSIDGPSILLVIEGSGTLELGEFRYKLEPGLSFFIPAFAPISVTTSKKLVTARAYAEKPVV